MFESQFGSMEDIVAAISIAVFGSLIIAILYFAKRFADEPLVTEEISSVLKTIHETPSQTIRERRSLFLELTRLESRKITPIPECDEEDCEDDDEEEKDESEYYGRKNDIENNYSISINSTASVSQDSRIIIIQRKRSLMAMTSSYSFVDKDILASLPLPLPSPTARTLSQAQKPPLTPIATTPIRQTDPPDIYLPDESFYLNS